MIAVTTPTLEGAPIKRYYGIVSGETFAGVNLSEDIGLSRKLRNVGEGIGDGRGVGRDLLGVESQESQVGGHFHSTDEDQGNNYKSAVFWGARIWGTT